MEVLDLSLNVGMRNVKQNWVFVAVGCGVACRVSVLILFDVLLVYDV